MNKQSLLIPATLLAGVASAQAAEDQRPNIVVIMVDDMGYSDIECYGSEIKTPNINSLAQRGVRYSQYYTASRSCPTRASLMTGIHQHQTGIGWMSEDPIVSGDKDPKDWGIYEYMGAINRNCVTLGEVLGEAGYHTYITGKWHLGMHGQEKWPLQRGFDHFYGILSGASSYMKPEGGRGLTLDNERLPAPAQPYYTTDAFTDYAMQFIEEPKDDAPFFLYMAYNAPHWPLQAKEHYINQYYSMYLKKGWDVIRKERVERMIELGIIDAQDGVADWENRHWNQLSKKEKERMAYRMAVYAGQIASVDENIGRFMDFLDKRGDLDNTLFMFVSDNGACAEPHLEMGGGRQEDINNPEISGHPSYGRAWAQVSNTPLRKYKQRAYEGGLSSPLIVSWGKELGQYANTWCTTPVYLVDIMPTVIEAAEAKYPKRFHDGNKIHPLVGESIFPSLTKGKEFIHDYMYWEHQSNRAVRWQNWKAVWDQAGQKWELYNVADDRSESNNVAAENPKILNRLTKKWDSWAKEHNVILNFQDYHDLSKEIEKEKRTVLKDGKKVK